jgi:para-aminobenzoate synthetase component I
MRKELPPSNPQTWLSRLGDTQRQVCMTAGNGEGWATTLAWNPCAQFVYRRNTGHSLADVISFTNSQAKLRRKVLGFISYDLGYELHGIGQTSKDDLALPDMYFLAFDNYLEITPDATTVHYHEQAFLDEAAELQSKPPLHTQVGLSQPFAPIMPQPDYRRAYDKIKRYILDGDVYQVNLTHRLEARTTADSRTLFTQILDRTNAGFMAYLEGPDFAILSASPERFVHIHGDVIETFPIKGTRPRGSTPARDEALRRELIGSTKDAAELNMITDLLRNDLGRICHTGSVTVEADRQLLMTPNVIHTFSQIRGKLRKEVSPIEAVLSMSPGGSITGCPKKRSMEIIDELEPFTRSVYCGSIVAIEPDGRLDSNIAIRTIIQKSDRLVLTVGGGIVHQSDGGEEYQESLDKAQSLVAALSGE